MIDLNPLKNNLLEDMKTQRVPSTFKRDVSGTTGGGNTKTVFARRGNWPPQSNNLIICRQDTQN
jgi:hypothetical protein